MLSDLMEHCHNLQHLTLAGSSLFHLKASWEIFSKSRLGLVYLNLLHCEIPEEGLAVSRGIPTLDTFLHESTLLPGLTGSYEWSPTEGNNRSLKICITHVYEELFQIPPQELSHLMYNFTVSRDERLLIESGLSYSSSGVEHPFMGPVSAMTCLQEFVKAVQMGRFSSDPRYLDGLLKRTFCRGYVPTSIVGLPVSLTTSRWNNDCDIDDQGTRLTITICRGRVYACFQQWSRDQAGTRVMERFTPQEYLARYQGQFPAGLAGSLADICAELLAWCGNGFCISMMSRLHGRGQEELAAWNGSNSGNRREDIFRNPAQEDMNSVNHPSDGDTDIEWL
jgi:hypothetical protein